MKIAILGGSFDPPHLGHLLVSIQVKEFLRMDEVWLMPCGEHPFHKHLSPAPVRLEMCKLLETDWLKVSDFELKKEGTSYTIETLQSLEKQFPEHEFYWCIGSDQLRSFQKWKDWKRLVDDYRLIVFPRGRTNARVSGDFSSGLLTGVPEAQPVKKSPSTKLSTGLDAQVHEAFAIPTIPHNITVLDNEHVMVSDVSSTQVREMIGKGQNVEMLVPEKVLEYIGRKGTYTITRN